MERNDRAGEQLFYTAWCLLQYVIFSWKSVWLFQISPSPSVALENALLAAREALHWSKDEGNRKADVGEHHACLEGKSHPFLK